MLTSFRDAKNHSCTKYSIARWQPKNTVYPELKFLAPKHSDGTAIKDLPPEIYRRDYEKYVLNKPETHKQLSALIDLMDDGDTIALLCWCNLARQAEYSKLFCHRILVGYYIEKNFPAVKVVYEDGAQFPVWDK